MRTTIDLPDDILRKAKIAAVERGTTLRELVSQALVRDRGLESPSHKPRRRIQFPLARSESPGSLKLTNADIQQIEDEEDERWHGLAD